MHDRNHADLLERVRLLETRLRITHGLGLAALVVLGTIAAARPAEMRGGPAPVRYGVLHVRGLVVEDSAGHARLLLGTPIPRVPGRHRPDAASGLVLLGADGADRLQLGEVGDPQMGGQVQRRMSPGTGLVVNDAAGDERAGFGVFENGQAGWGLDYPGREGIVAAVLPASRMAGIILSTDRDDGQRVSVFAQPGGSSIQVCDSTGTPRATLEIHGGEPPVLRVLDEKGAPMPDPFAGARKPSKRRRAAGLP
jgi:hypothetical protein